MFNVSFYLKRSVMKALIKKFITDEKGLETVEYAVMTALIVAAIITAIGLLVTAISGRFTAVAGTITSIST
jgi:Flp pilus assembly pilin Flp